MADSYAITPVYLENSLVDLDIDIGGRRFRLMGRFADRLIDGARSELENNPGSLPVLVGAGTKDYLQFVLGVYSGPLAIVDREEAIIKAAGTGKLISRHSDRILLVNKGPAGSALATLTRWQAGNSGRPFLPLVIPSYLRLNQEFYKTINSTLKASRQYDFWARTRYPRFRGDKPRILLITTNYFLMGEIIAACRRLGIEYHFISLEDQEVGREEFVQDFLRAVLEFKPDFVFTINHMGLDREGILLDLLARMELPLASWFVDNPHLILYLYENLNSPFCSIFTWDADNIQSLNTLGFEKVSYLPLATDIHRFSPGKNLQGFKPGSRDVSFVGNSMVHKVAIRLEKVRARDNTGLLIDNYRNVARAFADSDQSLVSPVLEKEFPELWEVFESLPDFASKLDFETLVTWEATRIYRNDCVKRILPFRPLIAGDDGWKTTLKIGDQWDYHLELNYYADLPGFYPHARINFNTTSAQMKGAVNQRVFDVPACGAFIITDYRKQIEDLFEPGREVICYGEPGEIEGLVRHYLASPGQRKEVSERARKRILAEHTYDHRLLELCRVMKRDYG